MVRADRTLGVGTGGIEAATPSYRPGSRYDGNGMLGKMFRQGGNGYDYAPLESFWGSLKHEMMHPRLEYNVWRRGRGSAL